MIRPHRPRPIAIDVLRSVVCVTVSVSVLNIRVSTAKTTQPSRQMVLGSKLGCAHTTSIRWSQIAVRFATHFYCYYSIGSFGKYYHLIILDN